MSGFRAVSKILKLKHILPLRRTCSTFEPEYLKSLLETDTPLYDTLNVQIKGYDYPILESYQKYVHRIAMNMGLEVEDGWACPPKKILVKKLKPNSTVLDCEYKLTEYERNVQIVDLPSTLSAIFFDVLHEALPEGVKLRVHEHRDEFDEERYVPDMELIELKTQLDSLGGPSRKRH